MAVKSMTGYGKGICEKDGLKLTLELKSVNHRFLDLTIKLPKAFNFAEDSIRKALKDNFARGHIDVFVNYEDTRENRNNVKFDYSLANAYMEASKKMAADMFCKENIGTFELLSFPDVVLCSSTEDDDTVLEQYIKQAMNQAIDKLSTMRATEGVAMQNDVVSKINNINAIVDKIIEKAPQMVSDHFDKVKARIKEMLQDVAIDEARLLNEVAFYTDKVCVDEEVSRLKSHISHFMEIMNKGGVVGKQLDFIVQEMNREANTCGSKCNNIEVSNLVVALKNEIEKVREQIQNIE